MLANGIKETTATTGTGTLTLVEAAGFTRMAAAFAVGELVSYAIKSGNGDWEWGVGKVQASNTLARTWISATYIAATGVYEAAAPTALSLVGTSEVYCAIHSNVDGIGTSALTHFTGTDGYIAGHTHTSTLALQNTSNTDNRYETCVISRPFLLSGLMCVITTAVASSVVRLGLYRAGVDGLPDKLVVDAGEVDGATTGTKVAAITPIILRPGLYYKACRANVGEPATRGAANTSSPPIPFGAGAATAQLSYYRAVIAYAAFADPAPSVTTGTNAVNSHVWLRGKNL